ncbi:MAG: hypothetical protein J2P49_06455 [Methylocapsa sp.]|nr:hypothetical protein [Methylocapsa sp.]
MVKATGARLFFLPSYSPGLNPIEQAFAKITWRMPDTGQAKCNTL